MNEKQEIRKLTKKEIQLIKKGWEEFKDITHYAYHTDPDWLKLIKNNYPNIIETHDEIISSYKYMEFLLDEINENDHDNKFYLEGKTNIFRLETIPPDFQADYTSCEFEDLGLLLLDHFKQNIPKAVFYWYATNQRDSVGIALMRNGDEWLGLDLSVLTPEIETDIDDELIKLDESLETIYQYGICLKFKWTHLNPLVYLAKAHGYCD